MNRYLLDTHVLLWLSGGEQSLSSKTMAAITAESERCWSPVSLWEIALLLEKRQIEFEGSLQQWITREERNMDLREVPVTRQVALEFGAVRLAHKDPADRLLVATARVYELTLVTADRALLASRACPMLNASAGSRRRPS
jgi:PIN domain nuclease of toxin-antitoxin system